MTIAMLTFHGTMTVLGNETGAGFTVFFGLGHIFLAIGMMLLFHTLAKAVKINKKKC